MTDNATRFQQHARILAEHSANVQAGDTVAIQTTTEAAPLVEALYERVLRLGGHPNVFLSLSRLSEIKLRVASDDQLRRPDYFREKALDHFDHIILIGAPDNTRSAGSTDPARLKIVAEGQRDVSDKWMRRIMQPTRGVTITRHPTPALAQDANMSLLDYEDFFYRACLLDDGIQGWQEMEERQQRLCDWLRTKSVLRLEGPDIDLSLCIEGRGWISDDGHKNFPGGEVFTSPVEDSVHGHVHFAFPAMHAGREARDVELWFEEGRVVRWQASAGDDYLAEMLNVDEGARRLGEFAIGTNYGVPRTTGDTLLDEKIGGSCHMAIGRGFPNLGSRNESAIHWDMVCDLKTNSTIAADGEVFYRDGRFLDIEI